jgi:DNA-binding CsgD family transcriptional regulator
MGDLKTQPNKPLHIYFRDDMDTYMTPEIMKNVMNGIDTNVKLCKSWMELSSAINDEPTSIAFHIDMVKRHGGTVPEFMLMLETLIKYSNPKIKPHIGVGIEADTSLSFIKELQKHKIVGIVPSATTFGPEHTNAAIKGLLNGEAHWPKDIISKLPGNKKLITKSNIHLTDRQTQVYDLIALRGLSNKQIARTLNISESTVKIHVSAIMKVLCVRNRTQLALTK